MNSQTSGSPETATARSGAESGSSDSPGEPEPGTLSKVETALTYALNALRTQVTGRPCAQIR